MSSEEEDVGIEAVPVLIELDENLKGRLVSDLACICDVTEEVAREMLVCNKWNMQNSIDKFLGSGNDEVETESNNPSEVDAAAIVSPGGDSKKEKLSELEDTQTKDLTTWAPEKLSVISWNLDGLDDHNLEKRTISVIALIEKDKYDIVFFQELIPSTFDFVARKLSVNYMPIPGTEDPNSEYLTATFLRLNRVHYKDHYIVPYGQNTVMGRNILVTEAFTGQAKLFLLNTHLESTAEFAKDRIIQLKSCFELCKTFPKDANAIFGGDLNLRDKEVEGLIPQGMCDLWIKCGSRASSQYTWDLTRNTNKRMPSQRQPRLRFDRFYFRESIPQTLVPEFFGVTGIEKVEGTQSFPSDHWAIITVFRLSKEARKPTGSKRKAESELFVSDQK